MMSVNPTHPVKPQPYLMQNPIQNYEWGTRNKEAYIPLLLGIAAKPDTPYGELWLGAHPKAPSMIWVDGELAPLNQWIAAHPIDVLGKVVAQKFNGQLPFLLKVLSAGEALSIQAHPNKAQAKLLHANDPQHYPDDNHKPEIAIALNSLTALVGIKPFAELADVLRRYPEICEFIGADNCGAITSAVDPGIHKQHESVRILFTALMHRSISHSTQLSAASENLALRLTASRTGLDEVDELFLSLRKKYTGADVGLFCVFLLNLVHLAEGEAIFTEAGVPHAYLKGNIIECMANSDNVVRVGLTTKFKDAKALLEIMRYEPGSVNILRSTAPGRTVSYKTAASEFRVSKTEFPAGVLKHESTADRPQILLVTQGEISIRWENGMETIRSGQSVFITANLREYSILAKQSAIIFKAEIPH